MSGEVVKRLDAAIEAGLAAQGLAGRMERTIAVASAVAEISNLLTPSVLTPVMALQGRGIGFKTDKDTSGGYPIEVVRDCLIEAAMSGVFPCNNEFNIIAGRAYVTKEGMRRKLSQVKGLSYTLTPDVPRASQDGRGAVCKMLIEWSYQGKDNKKEIDIPCRMSTGMGADAIVGKATRKALAWLYQTITGQSVPDGEAGEIEIVSPAPASDTTGRGRRKVNPFAAQETVNADITITT